MKQYKILAALLLLLAVTMTVTATAKGKKYQKMYVFGVSTSFNDSVVYFTPVQMLDSVATVGKTGMLDNKQEYSYQLKNYFTNAGMPHRTCITVNKTKKKDIDKLYSKMKLKLTKKENFVIKTLGDSDFKFERVVMAE